MIIILATSKFLSLSVTSFRILGSHFLMPTAIIWVARRHVKPNKSKDLIFSSLPNLLSFPQLCLSKWNHNLNCQVKSLGIVLETPFPYPMALPSTDLDSISETNAELVFHSPLLHVTHIYHHISTRLLQKPFSQSPCFCFYSLT